MFGNIGWKGAFTLGAMLLAIPALADDASGQAILVLDASGSMWGQVEGTPKIAIARDVIQGLMEDWDPNVALGVTAYGHREKGNCADIEALVPVGKVDGARVISAVEALNPKGKTPLTDAVRQAAETLRYTEERATVLLVSDGKETCDADPCAAASELEAAGIDFTVHVVGFDLTEEEKEQLQCIADNTGGKFLSADNAPELHAAMETTVQLVAEPEPTGPTGMQLTAVLAEGGDPVRAHFQIQSAEEDINGNRETTTNLSSSPNHPSFAEVPAGDYVITTRYDDVEVANTVNVEAGKLYDETIVLNAGRLNLAAILSEAGEPIGATLRVLEPEPDLKGRHEMIAGRKSKPDQAVGFGLPAGDYLVEAVYGDTEVTGNVQVKAGEITEKVMVMGAGFLETWGTREEGGEPMAHAIITVYEAEPGPDGKSVHVAGGVSKDYKNARFALATGRYLVTANDGKNGEASIEVEISSGEQTDAPIVVPFFE